MFKLLKEKLKGWITKAKETTAPKKSPEPTHKEKEKVVTTLKKPKKDKATPKKETKKPKKEKPEEKEEIKKEPIKIKTTKPTLPPRFEPKKKEPTPQPGIEPQTTPQPPSEPKEEPKPKPKEEPTETKKPGFLASLFSRKKEEPTPKEETIPEPKEEPEPKPEPETTLEPETEPETPKPKTSFFRKALTENKFEEMFDELELILLQNNVAYEAIENIKQSLKSKLVGESAKTDIEQALKESIEELLINPPNLIEQIKTSDKNPFVILFAGINGAGKTTTIAKVASLLKNNKLTVCLASADTFRAAAIEQLQAHADKLEIPLIKKDYGSDPASVGFDAIKYAKNHKIDVVLIDTAGRMNNRETLMKEIEKISRVTSPDLKIFLGESITGNDATQQAKDFNDSIGIDGIILSKADVDEKGGTAISVAQVTKKPIYFLGTGQKYEDLEIFSKENLIKKIFS